MDNIMDAVILGCLVLGLFVPLVILVWVLLIRVLRGKE